MHGNVASLTLMEAPEVLTFRQNVIECKWEFVKSLKFELTCE